MTEQEIKAKLDDRQALCMTIWAEARNERIEGEIAVGCVIRNRLLRPKRFAETWKGVCHQPAQFSCWFKFGGEKNFLALLARCEQSLRGQIPWPAQQMWIADGIISGAIEDRVAGADHYFASYMPKPPKWANGLYPVEIIGVHRFYQVA